jgi:hypothetical protein
MEGEDMMIAPAQRLSEGAQKPRTSPAGYGAFRLKQGRLEENLYVFENSNLALS